MSKSTIRARLFGSSRMPWLVPAAVGAVVVATAIAVPVIADTSSDLPERSAGELLAGLAGAPEVPLAGTIVHSADVGIPELPNTDGASSPLALLSGATSARVWYTDPTTYRVAMYGELTETDLIRDGADLWYWNSEQNVVMHGDAAEAEKAKPRQRLEGMLSPEAMAELALTMVEPSTEITVDGTATVAGRDAYELVAAPRDERSLIGSVRIAIDGEHGVPLRMRVYDAHGGEPAVEVGYTSISFSEPDASVYEFTPPPDATVEEFDTGQWMSQHGKPGSGKPAEQHGDLSLNVLGEGWTSALEVSGIALEDVQAHLEEMMGGAEGEFGDLSGLVDEFVKEMTPMSGEYGTGLGFQSRLISMLWLDDGRLLVGAVSLDVLEEQAK